LPRVKRSFMIYVVFPVVQAVTFGLQATKRIMRRTRQKLGDDICEKQILL
ncbi:Hypothetical protein FKW44_024837, partial [Caligus rogercresseyi]